MYVKTDPIVEYLWMEYVMSCTLRTDIWPADIILVQCWLVLQQEAYCYTEKAQFICYVGTYVVVQKVLLIEAQPCILYVYVSVLKY